MKRLILLLFITSLPIGAELSPEAYKKMRAEAPEVLTLIITRVSRGWCVVCNKRDVKVEALVQAVEKSATGIKKAQTIFIEYRHKQLPKIPLLNSPSPIPLLKENNVYRSFLIKKKKGDSYKPAAEARSFEELM